MKWTENWDAYTGQEAGPSTSQGYEDYGEDGEDYAEPNCEDPDFIVNSSFHCYNSYCKLALTPQMDCDYEENVKKKQQKEMVEMTKRNRGRKKSAFAKKLEEKKPVFDPTQWVQLSRFAFDIQFKIVCTQIS